MTSQESGVQVQESEITRLCNVRDSTFSELDQEQTGGGAVELPGQVPNFSDSEEVSESSSNEFNLEIFRSTRYPSKAVMEVASSETETTINFGDVKVIKFLGINFDVAILQERNKDPLIVLKAVSGTCFMSCMLTFITSAPGTNFSIIYTIIGVSLIIISTINSVQTCQTSTKNMSKFDLKQLIVIILLALLSQGYLASAFLIKMPFNSLPFFLLSVYLTLIFVSIQILVQKIPDFTPWDHPNYQLLYFLKKCTMGFFNGTAMMDVLSDFVLGVQLIIRFRNHFLYLGILLLIFCCVDNLFTQRRMNLPEDKISFKEYLLVAFVEILIISLTVIVMFGVSISHEKQDDEALFVTVISLNTTVVNFLHQLFFLYQKFGSKVQQDQVKDFS